MQRKNRVGNILAIFGCICFVLWCLSWLIYLIFIQHGFFVENILKPIMGKGFVIAILSICYGGGFLSCGDKTILQNRQQSAVNEIISLIVNPISLLLIIWSIYQFCIHSPIFERLPIANAATITIVFCLSLILFILSPINYYSEFIKIKPKPEVDVLESKSGLNSSN